MEGGDAMLREMIEEADLKAASSRDKKEPDEDPRLKAVNVIADEVRDGNMRTLRNVVTNHFKTINRR